MAKKNLESKYKTFGIQEHYDLSMQKLCEAFEWSYTPQGITAKKTSKKDVLDDKTLEVLKENHQLDVNLYSFAKELFNS